MVWKITDPQGNEAAKVRYDIVPYTRGRVLDLGCGPFKAFPHFLGVDNGHHAREFGWQFKPEVTVETCERLEGEMTGAVAKRLGLLDFPDEDAQAAAQVHTLQIPDASCDAVFSSHLLEHIQDAEGALREWWRVLKVDGHLVLYVPDEDLYPKVGEVGANPDHKWNLNRGLIVKWMEGVGAWDLVVSEQRNQGYEYSDLMVFRKLADGQFFSHAKPRHLKTACVVRYGGIGDMLMMSSVLPQLKAKGYHVTVMTTPNGKEVVKNDPNIDAFLLQDTDQVPNAWLTEHFFVWAKKFNRFVNLCESVEGNLLPLPGTSRHGWPDAMRQKYLNENYLEFQHQLAGLEYMPRPRFYATREEITRVQQWRAQLGPHAYVVLWVLAGSSMHKTYPHTDAAVAQLLMRSPDVRIIFVGDMACQILEAQWELEERVTRLSGKIGVRETLALACHGVDCVVGPETGVLNAVSHLKVPKVVMLSHSSVKNLTRNWANTVNLMPPLLEAPCFPCHRLHHDRTFCPSKKLPLKDLAAEIATMDAQDRAVLEQHIEGEFFDTGAALCAYGIAPERVARAVLDAQPKRIAEPA